MERDKKVKRSKTLVERENGEAKENGKKCREGELFFLKPSPYACHQGHGNGRSVHEYGTTTYKINIQLIRTISFL